MDLQEGGVYVFGQNAERFDTNGNKGLSIELAN